MPESVLTVQQRRVPAGAPVAPPPGAVSSPFDMATKYRSGAPAATPAPAAASSAPASTPPRKGRGPGLVTRAKQLLESSGPLSEENLAIALDIEPPKARTLVAKGIKAGHWTRAQVEGETRVVLVTKVRRARKAAAAPERAARIRKPSLLQAVARIGHDAAPIVPAPDLPDLEPQFGLFNTGELRIEYAGQEMRLPKKVTRALVEYLDQLASSLRV